MNTENPFVVGEVLESANALSFARKIRVKEATPELIRCEVLEGANTRDLLTVFRAGWYLYRKVSTPQPTIQTP